MFLGNMYLVRQASSTNVSIGQFLVLMAINQLFVKSLQPAHSRNSYLAKPILLFMTKASAARVVGKITCSGMLLENSNGTY